MWLNREVAKRLYAVRDLSKQIDAVQADTANKKDTVQPSGAVTVTTPSDKEMSPPVYVQAVCVCLYVCLYCLFFSACIDCPVFASSSDILSAECSPEALGVVCGTMYIVCIILVQVFYATGAMQVITADALLWLSRLAQCLLISLAHCSSTSLCWSSTTRPCALSAS